MPYLNLEKIYSLGVCNVSYLKQYLIKDVFQSKLVKYINSITFFISITWLYRSTSASSSNKMQM